MVFTKHITVDWTVNRKFQINIMISDTVYLSAVDMPIQKNRNNIIEQMVIGKFKAHKIIIFIYLLYQCTGSGNNLLRILYLVTI